VSGPPLSHQGSVKYADYKSRMLLTVMGQEWATHRLRERKLLLGNGMEKYRNVVVYF